MAEDHSPDNLRNIDLIPGEVVYYRKEGESECRTHYVLSTDTSPKWLFDTFVGIGQGDKIVRHLNTGVFHRHQEDD